MATTFVDYTGDGNATKSFSFPARIAITKAIPDSGRFSDSLTTEIK